MISSRDIINNLAKEKKVEKLVRKYTDFTNNPYIEDLIQDIYVSLMEKENIFIQNLYKNDELDYFIIKMIKNNLYSTTSPFFVKYQKFRTLTEELGDFSDE